MKKPSYVVGFMFSPEGKMVVLIEKQKPEWQKGCLNGVGGKIEEGENPHEAMVREFKEETGVEFHNWRQYCIHEFEHCTVHFFSAFSDKYIEVDTMESEQILITSTVPVLNDTRQLIPNLYWLIPMALHLEDDRQIYGQEPLYTVKL